MLEETEPIHRGYVIFRPTFFQGKMPACYGENDHPFVFATELDAQREIADTQLTRLREFLDGQRDYEDAISTDEYVLPVEIRDDGSVLTADGDLFGKAE